MDKIESVFVMYENMDNGSRVARMWSHDPHKLHAHAWGLECERYYKELIAAGPRYARRHDVQGIDEREYRVFEVVPLMSVIEDAIRDAEHLQ